MSEEKTIEELQAELESLKKARIEKELAKEKELVAAEESDKMEKEMEVLRQEGYEKALEEMSEKSKVVKSQAEKVTMEKKDRATKFADAFVDRNGLTGLNYEDLIKELVDGKGKAGLLNDIKNRERTWRKY